MKHLFIFITLAAISTSILSQTNHTIYWINTDTIVSGDSVRLDMVTSYNGPGENIIFRLVVDYPCWGGKCLTDTIYAYQFEKNHDTVYSAWLYIPANTTPGNAYLEFYNPEHTFYALYSDYLWVVSRPIIIEDLRDTTVCEGETFFYGVRILALEWPVIEWYHNGVFLEESPDTGLFIHEFSISDTGSYYCILTNSVGSTTSNIARISLPPMFENIGKPNGMSTMCMGQGSTSYYISQVPEITLYSWTLIPLEAGDLTYKDTSATISWDSQFSGQAKLFVKVKSGDCQGPNSDTLTINIHGQQPGPEICIVGVDPVTGNNMVVWEMLPGSDVQTYIIHRETNQAGVYLPLDTIKAGEMSVYTDATSTPDLVSQRYKLSLVDTCGFESELSTAHKTIHLTNNMAANGNVNLIWDGYEGFAFLTYNLYHGSHPDSMEYLNSIPSNLFIYSNIVPFPGNNYFQIEAIRPEGCSPSLKSVNYGSSLSNLLYVETENEVVERVEDEMVLTNYIYPVPATHILFIDLPGYTRPVPARLLNGSGNTVSEFLINSPHHALDVRLLPDGLYAIQVFPEGQIRCAKFLKIQLH
jgi:hypothetical protein